MFLHYTVSKNNLTIDYILKNELNISSRLRLKLINNNSIYLNNVLVDTRKIVSINDKLKIDLNYKEDNSNIVPFKMNLDIIYEDEGLLIINKPSGIPTHPSILHFENSLSNGVKYYFNSINLHKKIRPVNRLDLHTSGLIIFAKNEYIQECLINQMNNNTFKKEYLAVVNGILEIKRGTINKPIARKQDSIIERCINENGKPSITHYEVLEEIDNKYSIVKCILETGRTHQIRVHFASIGHSLVGDSLYGIKNTYFDGQLLICTKLSFLHPITKKIVNFSLPNSIELLKNKIKN